MNSPSDKLSETPLNPALKSRTERVYDTRNTTPAPIDTTSATEGEGEGWPWIWLVITAICIAVAIYLIV